MCDVCKIVEEIGEEKAQIIAEAAQERWSQNYELMIASVIDALGATSVKLDAERVRKISDQLETGYLRMTEEGEPHDPTFSMELVVDESKPKAPDEDVLDVLLKSFLMGE